MKVSVTDLNPTQKKLEVQIPAKKVQSELEKRYRQLARRVRLKGFRPGKVPRTILKSYYGKSVEAEVSNELIRDSFPDALKESGIKPLAEADVDDMEFTDDGSFVYSASVAVSPPIEIGEYRGIEVAAEAAEVSDEEVEAELEKLRQQHTELKAVDDPQQAVEEGVVAVIDFTPSVDGEVFEQGVSKDFMLEVGQGNLHPDFDGHVIGAKAGEEVEFDLDYPEDAPPREIAGKRVHFTVAIKEIKRKQVPEADDAFARKVGSVETLAELKDKIRAELLARKERNIKKKVHEQLIDRLVTDTPLEVPEKAVSAEIERMIGQLQQQVQSQGLEIDSSRFDTPEIRAEYRPQAEKSVRWVLIAEKIAELEGLELSDEELKDLYQQMARMLRTDVETVKEKYADSAFLEQLKASKVQEKVLALLEDNAVVKPPSEGQGEDNQNNEEQEAPEENEE